MLGDLRKCTGHKFSSQPLIILFKKIFVFYISYISTGLFVIYDELDPIIQQKKIYITFLIFH